MVGVDNQAVFLSSLADFAENFDTEEGHDQMLRTAIESLPVKPKKNKVLKIRMQKALEDLLLRFSVFEQLDEDGDCFIDEEEAKSPVAKKAISKTGGGESVGAVRGGCDGGERQLPDLPRALRRRQPGRGRRRRLSPRVCRRLRRRLGCR